MKLRPHQKKQNKTVRKALKKQDHILFGAPTGFGKSVCILDFVQREIDRGGRVLVIAPRRKLVWQLMGTFKEERPALLMGSDSRGNTRTAPLVVASLSTLHRRLEKGGRNVLSDITMIIIDECFTGDVEVLTDRGFVRFDSLSKEEQICQYDMNTELTSFVEPIRYIEQEYEGDMVTFKSDRLIDVTVTPNHDMLVRHNKTKELTKVKAKDLNVGGSTWSIPVCGEHLGGVDALTNKEKLLIMYQADGTFHYITTSNKLSKYGRQCNVGERSFTIVFKKQRKINDFLELMEAGKFEYHHIKHNEVRHTARFSVLGLDVHLHKYIRNGFDLSAISSVKAQAIIDYMVKWDGSIISDTLFYFSSVLEDNVDFYQEVAILAGYKTHKTKQVDNRKESFNDIYRLTINMSITSIGVQQIKKSVSYYKGKVYCVTVPTGNIIVRRNGKAIVCGNCHISFNMPDGVPSLSASKLHELYWGKIKWVGFTATPITAGGYRLEGWDETIYEYDAAWLIRKGWLAEFDYFSVPSVDVRGLRVQSSTGDFSVSDMEEVTNTATSIKSVVDNYRKYGSSTKTLIFAASIIHAELITQGFKDDGIIDVRVIHSNLSEKEQQEILEEYQYNAISVLINVAMLTTGFDDPEVETLIIARPIGSVRLALQVYGRALRKHDDIPTVTILDLCSVWDTTGILPDMAPNWNRRRRKPGDVEDDSDTSIEDILWECDACHKPFRMVDASKSTAMTEELLTTTYFCPKCGQVAREDTKDLSTPKIEKIKTATDIDYTLRTYSGREAIEVIARLVTLNTRAKTGWAAYIHKKCMKTNRLKYREIIYGYEQEIFKPGRAWKLLMGVYDA